MNNTASSLLNSLDSDIVLALRESAVGKVLAATVTVLEQTYAETDPAFAAYDAAEALSKRNKSRAAILAALTPAYEAAKVRRNDAFKAYYAARQLFVADRHKDRLEEAAAVVALRYSLTSDIGTFVAAAKDALLVNKVITHVEFTAAAGIVGTVHVREGRVDDVSFTITADRGGDTVRPWTCVYVRSNGFHPSYCLSTIGTNVEVVDARQFAAATSYAADVATVLTASLKVGAVADARDLADALFPVDHIA